MADRRVTATGKDSDGDITRLCNSGELWSPRSKADAVNDIENRTIPIMWIARATGRMCMS